MFLIYERSPIDKNTSHLRSHDVCERKRRGILRARCAPRYGNMRYISCRSPTKCLIPSPWWIISFRATSTGQPRRRLGGRQVCVPAVSSRYSPSCPVVVPVPRCLVSSAGIYGPIGRPESWCTWKYSSQVQSRYRHENRVYRLSPAKSSSL